MVHMLTSISRFSMLFCLLGFTYYSFRSLSRKIKPSKAIGMMTFQRFFLFLLIINANLVMYLNTNDITIIGMMLLELLLCIIIFVIFSFVYEASSRPLVNNMALLISLGLIELTRMDIVDETDRATKQMIFAYAAIFISCIVPFIVVHLKNLDRLWILYTVVGIGGLLVVLVMANVTYGAKLSISLGPVTIQPSEFIKILYIFAAACLLHTAKDFKSIVFASAIAAVHVLILVASRDLGSGLIYLFTYLVMVYVATDQIIYMFLGTIAGSIASVAAYFLFGHVRNRVYAFLDPISVIDGAGYQVSQSLFAITSGGFLGTGLCEGMPGQIPVSESDFIFSAICEEFGVVFGILLIFVYISSFLLMFNISLQITDKFYKLIALGIGTLFCTQTFLALGGVIKFIPSTGVTLPLISHGGSSLVSMIFMFAIIQGLYIKRSERIEEIYAEQEYE